jgi:hypothetical protein
MWSTACGTFDAVMQDTLVIRADGTGHVHRQSALRGEERLAILWRHSASGVVEFALVWPDDVADARPEWETIRYQASTTTNDAASGLAVLKNEDSDNFWNLTGPIAWVDE